MHNMKKILAGLLVLLMVLALVACKTPTPEPAPEQPISPTVWILAGALALAVAGLCAVLLLRKRRR